MNGLNGDHMDGLDYNHINSLDSGHMNDFIKLNYDHMPYHMP